MYRDVMYGEVAEDITICKSATAGLRGMLYHIDPHFSIPWSITLETRCFSSPSCGALVLSAHP